MATFPVRQDELRWVSSEHGKQRSSSAHSTRFSSGSLNSISDHNAPPISETKVGCREPYTARIVFKSRGRILFLPVTDIRWIAAEENYVRICTDKETHLLRQTMTGLEQKLDPQMFLRVHRSAIVNLQFVKEVRTESQGDFVVHLVNGHKLSMSRSYHSRLGNLLTRSSGRVA